MNIVSHGSLGDQVMLTGLPEALLQLTGESSKIIGQVKSELWLHNPYIIKEDAGREFSYSFNTKSDYMIYYPVRIFYEMTGMIVDRFLVQPNLYRNITKIPKRIVVNDQAGWPTRRGYPYFNDLCKSLKDLGYEICYLRHNGFRDCNGNFSERVITNYSYTAFDTSLEDAINRIGEAEFYIGYDSGYSQLAGALKTKYVLISGSVAPINTAHDSCIYTVNICPHCGLENCEKKCLEFSYNFNHLVLERIVNGT